MAKHLTPLKGFSQTLKLKKTVCDYPVSFMVVCCGVEMAEKQTKTTKIFYIVFFPSMPNRIFMNFNMQE